MFGGTSVYILRAAFHVVLLLDLILEWWILEVLLKPYLVFAGGPKRVPSRCLVTNFGTSCPFSIISLSSICYLILVLLFISIGSLLSIFCTAQQKQSGMGQQMKQPDSVMWVHCILSYQTWDAEGFHLLLVACGCSQDFLLLSALLFLLLKAPNWYLYLLKLLPQLCFPCVTGDYP